MTNVTNIAGLDYTTLPQDGETVYVTCAEDSFFVFVRVDVPDSKVGLKTIALEQTEISFNKRYRDSSHNRKRRLAFAARNYWTKEGFEVALDVSF